MKVTVWICPSFGCGNYFASSSVGDLSTDYNTDAKGELTFPRAQCPDCNLHGRVVMRTPVNFEDGLDAARRRDHEQRRAAT